MRSVNAEIVEQLESGAIKPYLLLSIEIGAETYRLTTCMVPIALDGALYQPRSFEVQNIRYSTGQVVDKANIRLDNLDDYFTAPFVGGDPQGSSVVLSLVVLDDNNQPVGDDSTALFYGEIDDWVLEDGELNFGMVNAYARWPKKKTARHPSSCRWRSFKDDDCKYTGADTTCGRTYSDCQAKGNEANYGGFRWLPSIENKEVWWGKRP